MDAANNNHNYSNDTKEGNDSLNNEPYYTFDFIGTVIVAAGGVFDGLDGVSIANIVSKDWGDIESAKTDKTSDKKGDKFN